MGNTSEDFNRGTECYHRELTRYNNLDDMVRSLRANLPHLSGHDIIPNKTRVSIEDLATQISESVGKCSSVPEVENLILRKFGDLSLLGLNVVAPPLPYRGYCRAAERVLRPLYRTDRVIPFTPMYRAAQGVLCGNCRYRLHWYFSPYKHATFGCYDRAFTPRERRNNV